MGSNKIEEEDNISLLESKVLDTGDPFYNNLKKNYKV